MPPDSGKAILERGLPELTEQINAEIDILGQNIS